LEALLAGVTVEWEQQRSMLHDQGAE